MKDRFDDPSHNERTLLPQNDISLLSSDSGVCSTTTTIYISNIYNISNNSNNNSGGGSSSILFLFLLFIGVFIALINLLQMA